MEMIERLRGSLLSLAAGDVLGTTLEFKPTGSFTSAARFTVSLPEHFTGGKEFLRSGALLAKRDLIEYFADNLFKAYSPA